MSDVTIKQLARVLDMPSDRLLTQLAEAGMDFSDPDDVVSNDEKTKLLQFLRSNHGKAGGETTTSNKQSESGRVTLRRRKRSELQVPSGGGSSPKTVNVEVRGKRTYLKGDQAETGEAPTEDEREQARRKLEESRQQREQEEVEKEEQQRRREEKARQDAEAEAQAEEERRRAAEAAETADAPTEAEPVTPTEAPAEPESPDTETATGDDAAAPAPSTESEQPASAWDKAVMPQVHERRKPAVKKAAPASKTAASGKTEEGTSAKSRRGERDNKGAGKGQDKSQDKGQNKSQDKSQDKRKGGGRLHLSQRDRTRRATGAQRNRSAAKRPAGSSSAHGFSKPTAPVVREVPLGEANVVTDLAQKMAVKGGQVVKALFNMGVMATINQSIDHDTAVLVVEELGHKPVAEETKDAEATLMEQTASANESGREEARPPVITIMGHVDHGKTSLLDYLRRTMVASGEAGGITQHIGAYHLETDKGVITFLDTPGHEAFSSMRSRGAQSTDIVVLVVAADDGVKPQTIEAIEHARAAKTPIVVAVNKMDVSGANIDNVKRELTTQEVVPEDWGGDVQILPISAKTGEGLPELLDAISLQAELMELKAVVDGRAAGTVIEARLERGRGPVATVLVQRSTLTKGDFVVCGVEYGRMRALEDENGVEVESAGPSIPVKVLGLSGVPDAGDDFVVVADDKLAKQVAEERAERRRESRMVGKADRLEDIMAQMGKSENQQVLNIVVKADVQGSAEALRESLGKVGNEQVKVKVISSGVGGITASDANLASASDALLIGFNVRADASARKIIETQNVDLRYFSIIYDVIDQVTQAASGLLGNEVREQIIGTAEVQQVFRSSRLGAVAGSMVTDGVVRRSKPIRVLRDNTVVFEGELESLRRHKDDVEEVRGGTECGIAVKQYNDVVPGDQIECFERIEVAREL